MGLFNFFKKKEGKKEEKAEAKPVIKQQEEILLDDYTYVKEMRITEAEKWKVYDILLAAQGYGWETMKQYIDYLAKEDFIVVETLCYSEMDKKEIDVIDAWRANNNDLYKIEVLNKEHASLSLGGVSETLKDVMKIFMYNQTKVIRIITQLDHPDLIERYIDTLIRCTFKTKDAMKKGKPIPKKDSA